MAETTLQLGFVPKNRGEYQSTPVTRYYKDNVVQYNGSSYIADPVGWSESDPTATYVTIPPTDESGSLNAGWKVFASGNNTFTTGEKVDNIGIDDEPTAGSKDLLESGGTKLFIDKKLGNLIYGKAINTLGQEVDAEGMLCTDIIPVSNGDTFKYTSGSSSTAAIDYSIAIYDSNGTMLNQWRGTNETREITISNQPTCAYCRASFVESGTYSLTINNISYVFKGIGNDIHELQKGLNTGLNTVNSRIDSANNNIQNLQSTKLDTIRTNKLIGNLICGKSVVTNTGVILDNPNTLITIKIPAVSGDVISYTCGQATGTLGIGLVAFDSSDNRLDGWGSKSSVRTITLPANTAYIIATFYSLLLDNAVLLKNNVDVLELGSIIEDQKATVLNSKNIYLINAQNDHVIGNLVDGVGINVYTLELFTNTNLVTTKFISVSEGDVLKYKAGASTTSSSSGLVICGRLGTRIDYYGGTSDVREITVPSGSAYITATFVKGTSYSLTINRNDEQGDVNLLVEDSFHSMVEDISNLQEEVNTINTNLIFGKAVLSDGTLVSASNMIATKKISANENDSVVYVGGAKSMSSLYYSLVAYDASDSVLNYWRGSNDEREITLPLNTSYIRATFAQDTDFSLTINNKDVIFDKILNNIILKDKEQDKRLDVLELSASDRGHLMPINVFGDILPAPFKEKLMNLDSDLLIVCQGDSLTGLIEECDTQEEPEHCPPGCQYKSWLYMLQQNISKKKPVCDRVDSQRNNVDVFTKTGTWENVVTIGRTDIYGNDGTVYGQQRTVSALTFQCPDSNAALAFEFDADTYEKCNIVFSKEPDGVLTKIVIAEGNGYMLVSEDRTNWVEANNYQYSQRTFATVTEGSGNANRESQRRLWMKKAMDSVTGTVHISYQRDNSTLYENSYMYVWGIEKWSDYAVFVDNLGRGGRTTRILKANISDIFDRHPDLAIYEMPLANEISHSNTSQTRATLKGSDYYGGYFLGSGTDSFKTRSNNYTTLPLIVILPHGRSTYFNNSNSAVRVASSPEGEPNTYTCAKQMYSWLKDQLKIYDNVSFINLYDQLINEALVLDNQINRGFYGAVKSITADSVHLSQYGACLWNKYLAGVFDSI